MKTVIRKSVTHLTDEIASVLTQQFEVELVTETRIEMQTKTETQTRIEMQTQVNKEIQIVDGEEVEVEFEVEVPVEVEFEAEVKVPVEVEVEVERETQIGSNYRCTYTNSESGRADLVASETEEIVSKVMKKWGNYPTVETQFYFDDSAPTDIDILYEIEADQELRICCLEMGLSADDFA